LQVGQTCQEGSTPAFEHWDWSRQHDNPNTVRDRFGLACKDPFNEATCPIARKCVEGSGCYADTPDWLDIDELVRHLGLNVMKEFADDPKCTMYTGSNDFSQMASLDKDGKTEVPCTFERHRLILSPSDAYLYANWPFLSKEYMRAYTQVAWSLEARVSASPPASLPPASYTTMG